MVGITSISAILTNHVRSNVSLAAGNNGCGQHMKLEDACGVCSGRDGISENSASSPLKEPRERNRARCSWNVTLCTALSVVTIRRGD